MDRGKPAHGGWGAVDGASFGGGNDEAPPTTRNYEKSTAREIVEEATRKEADDPSGVDQNCSKVLADWIGGSTGLRRLPNLGRRVPEVFARGLARSVYLAC